MFKFSIKVRSLEQTPCRVVEILNDENFKHDKYLYIIIRKNNINLAQFEQNSSLLTNSDGTLTKRGQQIINQTPMGRYGVPEDLVGTTLWLCGEGSKFVTGVVIPIDGGFSAYSGV